MRARGWTFPEAATEVTKFLGGEAGGEVEVKAQKSNKRPARIPEIPPAGTPPPALGKAVAMWCYGSVAGEPWYYVQRIEDAGKPDKRGKPSKTMVRRFWLDGKWHFPSRRDPFSIEWPAPRPLLGWDQLGGRIGDPVLIVEGETTWDAASLLFPGYVVLTWPNGSKSVQLAGWSKLAGRDCVIWPDADPDGATCAKKLTGILREAGAASIAVVTPPPGKPLGWDLADAGDWTEADAQEWLEGNLDAEDVGGPGPGDSGGGGSHGSSGSSGTRPFGLLGFAGDNFYYQPDESGQITVIARPKHNGINMLGLARLAYWQGKYPVYDKDGNFRGIDWQSAFDDIFAEQYRVGFFDPDRIRGLGAWWDRGRVVLHLGDRLIVDGNVHYLTRPFESNYCYQRLRRLEGPGDAKPLSDEEARQVLEIAACFQWEDQSSAFLLAGWLVLAAIGGCLKWRPHVWMTAAAGAGKSTILERFVGVLLGDMFIQPEGNATEPGIRQELMSSAVAVILDEAGAAKEKDKARIQAIIEFARSCSSEGKGRILKGSADQSGAKKFLPRAMFLMSSVTTALKEGQDSSRFTQLTLRKNEKLTQAQQAAHWAQLDKVLMETITEEFALRLIARTINLIPMIREAADIFEIAAAEHLGTQRLGQQYGALSAGAWSLCSQKAPTLEEARAWLAQHPLTTQAEQSETDDEKSCLQTILEHQVRVDVDGGVKTRSVLSLLEIANSVALRDDGIDQDRAIKALGAIGVGLRGGRLLISNTAKGLKRLLKETPWESCWPTVLSRMEGAEKPGNAFWFAGVGTTRATSLPMPAVREKFGGFVSP